MLYWFPLEYLKDSVRSLYPVYSLCMNYNQDTHLQHPVYLFYSIYPYMFDYYTCISIYMIQLYTHRMRSNPVRK